ncbi:MAG: class I SAM-dependent methyltransferase, partial [Bacteroidota bacterium]
MNKEFWNQRYSANDYAYGKAPNVFFAEQLRQLTPGKILLPADGEGRNSVFAATLGWEAIAFDISSEGKQKAEQLANEKNVSIEYLVGDLESLDLAPQSFDAMALIYAHFPPAIKSKYHQLLQKYLKPGGIVILEAFSKTHLHYRDKNPKVGGPNNLGMLFSEAEIEEDFKD